MLVPGKVWDETVCCSFTILPTCWFQERSEMRLFVALSQCCQHVGSRKDLSWDCLLLFHNLANMLIPGKIWDETVCSSFTVLSTCWFQERSEMRLFVALSKCCQHVGSRKGLRWDCLLLFHSVVNMLVPGKIWDETVCCSFTVLSTCWFQERSEMRLFVALSQCCQHVGSRKGLRWDCLLLFHSVVNMLVPVKGLRWDCFLLFHSVANMLIPGKIWDETVALSQCCQHVGSRKGLRWDCLLLFHSVVNMLVPGKTWDETVCCSFTILPTCWFQERSEMRLFVALSQCCQHVGSRKGLRWDCLLLFHSVANMLVPGKI